MPKFSRTYTHAEFGKIGAVEIQWPEGDWMLDGKALPEKGVAHFINHALQSLQDAYAAAKSAGEARGAFSKKYDRILAGKIGVGTRESDPIVAEMKRLAKAVVEKAVRAANIKLASVPVEAMAKLVADYISENEAKLRSEAEDNVRRAADLAGSIDLSGLTGGDESEGDDEE